MAATTLPIAEVFRSLRARHPRRRPQHLRARRRLQPALRLVRLAGHLVAERRAAARPRRARRRLRPRAAPRRAHGESRCSSPPSPSSAVASAPPVTTSPSRAPAPAGSTASPATSSPSAPSSRTAPWTRDPEWAERHERRRLAPPVLRRWLAAYPWQLKFVVTSDAKRLSADLDEIETLLTELQIPNESRHQVLLMPECTDPKRLSAAYRQLVPVCLERGFRLGERLHIALFGHTPGT